MNQHRRATDGPAQGRFWVWLRGADWLLQRLVPVFAVAVAAYAVYSVEGQNNKLEAQAAATKREGVVRRDQNCIVFERSAVTAVNNFHDAQRQLDQTVAYLAKVPAQDQNAFFTQAIRANLPQLHREVRQRWDEANSAKAPPYCDRPDVGLPEPSPILSPKPR